ncbi:carbonic anhydrase family protein [Thiomicrorhabdus sp. ZW0627]|uniref:carbonic anhydrase n=1 Tax=Thiomicrorhabdus sp. ZW0627 TaxID=3039774 RepID=UPI0024369FD6|nr:carbonic anhydrase family protein [Thiomicrorhabdus sp. ZW0627]MDG6774145.1 carbonic anhydrase family protein [Thiomicrorhabdus sp. ZW0627]
MRPNFSLTVVSSLLFSLLISIGAPVTAADVQLTKPLVDLNAEAEKLKQEKEAANKAAAPAVKHAETVAAEKTPKTEHPAEAAKQNHVVHWGYSGEGRPEKWGDLSSDFATCNTGRNQSPIDLRDKAALGTQGLPNLDIVYREVPLKIINNGHSIQINFPLGSYIKVGGHRFELMQYHFHTPSEHHKEGFAYPMEMHLVHKDGDGNLAVLGVLFQEGEENPYLNGLLKRLPKVMGKEEIHKDLKLNPAHFIPPNPEFYKYSGSLTTPPCSEGVYWMVFKHPIEASAEQIQQMNELMGDNARPVQPKFARSILKSWMEQDYETPLYEFY